MDHQRLVREAVYRHIVEHGTAPGLNALEAAAGLTPEECRATLRALHEGHVIVLQPDGETIRIAAPFAPDETRYRVRSADRAWYAPCAWDSLGIAAALRCDIAIDAACPLTGAPLEAGVRGGAVYGEAVVHMLVPAARFWDDIGFT